MPKAKRLPIQKIVMSIINEYQRLNPRSPYITTQQIINEARNTELASRDSSTVTGKDTTKLEESVYQSLRELKKKKLVTSEKKGYWSTTKKKVYTKKERPKSLCSAIQGEYEIHCNKCKTYSYFIRKKGASLPKKCPNCGSTAITKRLFRFWCPVNKMYISDPFDSCVLIMETDYSKIPTDIIGGAIKQTKTRPCWRK